MSKTSVESPELAKAGEESLIQSFAEIGTYPDRIGRFEVQQRSQFANDNKWTHEPLSDQVQHLIVSSYEHLNTLRRYVLGNDGYLPAMAGYTLVRSAIESASLAIWLTACGTADKRILRSLCLTAHNAWDMESFAAKAGLGDQPEHDRLRDKLAATKDQRKTLVSRRIPDFPKWSAIVENAAPLVVQARGITGIQAWKGASGIAHSNMSLTQGLLENKIGERPDGSTGRVMSTKVSTLAIFVTCALRHLEAAAREYERCSGRG